MTQSQQVVVEACLLAASWLDDQRPDGWFKLQGASFDTSKYPLHACYRKPAHTSGKLPSWGGYYPVNMATYLTIWVLNRDIRQDSHQLAL